MAFAAPGRNAGALLLEPVSVPRQQRDLAGIAELVDRVGGVAFVFDGQVHGPVSLLPAALRHEGGVSSRSGSPRKRHHLALDTFI